MRLATTPFIALAATLSAQAPTVVSTSPARHAIMDPFDPIRVVFAAPIAPATVTAQSFSVFGRWTGAVPGAISVDAAATSVTFQPTIPLFVGDFLQIDLANTITSALGAPMPGGFHFQVTVRSGHGSGVFQPTQTIPFRMTGETYIGTYGIHAGDIDRDGSPDVVAINESSHDIRVFKNGGCANLGAMTLVQDGSNWPSPHESADFNRDGWMDLVTGDSQFGNVSVFMNSGSGSYLPPLVLAGTSYARSVGTGDFNGDGFPDITIGNSNSTLVWINNGSGGFLAPVPYTFPWIGSAEQNVVDANEDGWLDIVGTGLSPGVFWVLLGNGDGTFTPTGNIVPIGAQPFASASGDVNGDGHIDIAYACNNPYSLVWILGDGLGNFAVGGTMPAGGYPTSIQMGDLDGDGHVDAVLSHFNSGDLYIYMNNGAGAFSAPVVLTGFAGASCSTLADFDRDGDLDIMGADEINDVGILFTQTNVNIPGLQPATCGATLRINQRADGAGFGGTTPVPVHSGAAMALSLSCSASAPLGVLFLGYPSNTSFLLPPWGLVSIDVLMPFVILTAAPPNQHGELMMALSFPASAPLGSTLAVQGLVFDFGAEMFTNPMQFTLVP